MADKLCGEKAIEKLTRCVLKPIYFEVDEIATSYCPEGLPLRFIVCMFAHNVASVWFITPERRQWPFFYHSTWCRKEWRCFRLSLDVDAFSIMQEITLSGNYWWSTDQISVRLSSIEYINFYFHRHDVSVRQLKTYIFAFECLKSQCNVWRPSMFHSVIVSIFQLKTEKLFSFNAIYVFENFWTINS